MAYVSQEKKARIAAALKLVMPKGWKYSLGVVNHSTIRLTISAAPLDLIGEISAFINDKDCHKAGFQACGGSGHMSPNPYWYDEYTPVNLLPIFTEIFNALNLENYDRSDSQTDYFDVGHYVELNIGRWNKPFVHLADMKVAA